MSLGCMFFGVHKTAMSFVWFLCSTCDLTMSAHYTETNPFFLGTSTDITSQMTVLHEQTDWPHATTTSEVTELQPSETQPSETLPVVARKQSNY